MQYIDGTKYIGEWYKDKKHGKGKLIQSNGEEGKIGLWTEG